MKAMRPLQPVQAETLGESRETQFSLREDERTIAWHNMACDDLTPAAEGRIWAGTRFGKLEMVSIEGNLPKEKGVSPS